MAFSSSDKIIDLLKRQLGLTEDMYAVLQAWERELGPLAPKAKIAGVKYGTLYVEVASSAHFQELSLRRKSLIEKLNQYLGGKKVVQKISLKLIK